MGHRSNVELPVWAAQQLQAEFGSVAGGLKQVTLKYYEHTPRFTSHGITDLTKVTKETTNET